jgi:pantoate--beta-alanine ligase
MTAAEPLLIHQVANLHSWADRERQAGRTIALVPTMGALHDGHLSLVGVARAHASRVVVSIFVNPRQFGPGEDYERYPRDLAQDIAYLRRAGVDVIFAPSASQMYPLGDSTTVTTSGVTEGLCGRHRPGHFDGVTSIVARLLNAAKPHVAVFGEKDYQQLVAVRRMARDLLFDVEIVAAPTVRDPDGLAKSSRNAYLSPRARVQALSLNAGLHEARRLFRAGERHGGRLIEVVRRRIEKEPLAEIDYVELRDAETLAPLESVHRRAVLAVAARFDGARLIDNTILEDATWYAPC